MHQQGSSPCPTTICLVLSKLLAGLRSAVSSTSQRLRSTNGRSRNRIVSSDTAGLRCIALGHRRIGIPGQLLDGCGRGSAHRQMGTEGQEGLLRPGYPVKHLNLEHRERRPDSVGCKWYIRQRSNRDQRSRSQNCAGQCKDHPGEDSRKRHW